MSDEEITYEPMTIGWLGRVKRDMLEEGKLFAGSFELVGRAFLAKLWAEDTRLTPFEQLRLRFVAGDYEDEPDIPSDPDAFFRHLCQLYLDLESLPHDRLLPIYEQATRHLHELQETIAKLTARIERSQGASHSDHEYQVSRLYEYFRRTYLAAREEIVSFLSDERAVHAYACRRAQEPRSPGKHFLFNLSSLFQEPPYHYGSWSWQEDILLDRLSDLHNKLDNVLVRDFPQWDELYEHSGAPIWLYGGTAKLEEVAVLDEAAQHAALEKFLCWTRDYISRHGIVAQIAEKMASHPRLHLRQGLLFQALEAYRAGHYELFCSVVPLQIEGIFNDICIDAGLSTQDRPKTGDRGRGVTRRRKRKPLTLLPKLRLVSQAISFPEFTYYAFRFPLIRNRVAHGEVVSEQPELVAHMLLLDFRDVCSRLTSAELPMNTLVELLRHHRLNPDDMGTVLKIAVFELHRAVKNQRLELPASYALTPTLELVHAAYETEPFWALLRSLEAREEPMIRKALVLLLTHLKKPGQTRAEESLKAMGSRNRVKDIELDVSAFFQELGALQLLEGVKGTHGTLA